MFVKFFKRLVNVAVCNMFIICNNSEPQVTSPAGPDRQSINHPPERLSGRYFIEKIPSMWGEGAWDRKRKKIAKKV